MLSWFLCIRPEKQYKSYKILTTSKDVSLFVFSISCASRTMFAMKNYLLQGDCEVEAVEWRRVEKKIRRLHHARC